MLVVAPFGVIETWWGAVLAFLSQILVGTAFGSLVYALTTRMSTPEGFGVLFRLGVFPMFLFSGAFFPVANLGEVGAWVARLTPLWQGVNLSRMFMLDNVDWAVAAINVDGPARADAGGAALVGDRPEEAAGVLMATTYPDDRSLTSSTAADLVPPLTAVAAARLLVLRNYLVYRKAWKLFITGFLEPFFYLLSIGIGVGQLIESFEFNGQVIDYASFVAPGMLAASAFNGALIDMTFNVFFKLKFDKLYDQMLATPLSTSDIARGEIAWGQLRGGVYSLAFLGVMGVMGMLHSWWAVLALPAAMLIGFAFAAVCMGLTTYMRSWQDFDKITLAQLPLFLFSATFFPVTAYPDTIRWVVELTPLYRGVVLCRELTTGAVSMASVWSVVYLVVMGVLGLLLVRRRLDLLLLK